MRSPSYVPVARTDLSGHHARTRGSRPPCCRGGRRSAAGPRSIGVRGPAGSVVVIPPASSGDADVGAPSRQASCRLRWWTTGWWSCVPDGAVETSTTRRSIRPSVVSMVRSPSHLARPTRPTAVSATVFAVSPVVSSSPPDTAAMITMMPTTRPPRRRAESSVAEASRLVRSAGVSGSSDTRRSLRRPWRDSRRRRG